MIADGPPEPYVAPAPDATYPRMDPTLKVAWLEALRSGRFLQGPNRLKMSGRHCCLGVLCELAGLGQREVTVEQVGTVTAFLHGEEGESQGLPRGFAREAGISPEAEERVMFLNDTDMDFQAIAGWIERKL